MFSRDSWLAILFGLISIFVIIIVSSFILSIILKLTSVEESSLSWLILTLSSIALFIGGFISGGKGEEKGWLIGLSTGLLFTIIVFLVQYLGYESTFTIKQAIYHIAYLFIAAIGGIFGVNMAGKRNV